MRRSIQVKCCSHKPCAHDMEIIVTIVTTPVPQRVMVGFTHDSVAITKKKNWKCESDVHQSVAITPETIEYITSKRTIYRTKITKHAISHSKTKTGVIIKTSQCVQLNVVRYTSFKNIFRSMPFFKTSAKTQLQNDWTRVLVHGRVHPTSDKHLQNGRQRWYDLHLGAHQRISRNGWLRNQEIDVGDTNVNI